MNIFVFKQIITDMLFPNTFLWAGLQLIDLYHAHLSGKFIYCTSFLPSIRYSDVSFVAEWWYFYRNWMHSRFHHKRNLLSVWLYIL